MLANSKIRGVTAWVEGLSLSARVYRRVGRVPETVIDRSLSGSSKWDGIVEGQGGKSALRVSFS